MFPNSLAISSNTSHLSRSLSWTWARFHPHTFAQISAPAPLQWMAGFKNSQALCLMRPCIQASENVLCRSSRETLQWQLQSESISLSLMSMVTSPSLSIALLAPLHLPISGTAIKIWTTLSWPSWARTLTIREKLPRLATVLKSLQESSRRSLAATVSATPVSSTTSIIWK
jgi:hypothetical protein